jgi:hypothetical protein
MDFGEFKMINIVCLKWGSKYGSEYVNRLYASVERNTTKKFKFWCFTDDASFINSDINVQPLLYSNLETWWNKLYLFSNDISIPAGEKIFYIDLDTLITNNIDDLLDVNIEKIVVLKDFLKDIAVTAGEMGSGLMAWKHGVYCNVWEKFIVDPDSAIKQVAPHGDQHWIDLCVKDRLYWQDLFPDRVVSFKVHCLNGLPDNAAIVCYHGQPSIPESVTFTGKIWKFNITPQPWVLNYWKE